MPQIDNAPVPDSPAGGLPLSPPAAPRQDDGLTDDTRGVADATDVTEPDRQHQWAAPEVVVLHPVSDAAVSHQHEQVATPQDAALDVSNNIGQQDEEDEAEKAWAYDPHALSFNDLPMEIKLQILSNCDWRTLYRAGACCSSSRALVDSLVRLPYFRTTYEDDPVILNTEFDTERDQRRACENWADLIVAQLGFGGGACGGAGKPDLCLVFASCNVLTHSQSPYSNLPTMLQALGARLGGGTVVAGAIAHGLICSHNTVGGRSTGEAEYAFELEQDHDGDEEDVKALSVALVHLPPGTSVHCAYVRQGLEGQLDPGAPAWAVKRGEDGEVLAEGQLPPRGASPPGVAGRRSWLVFSDTHAHVPEVLRTLNKWYPQDAIIGGMGGLLEQGSVLASLPQASPGSLLRAGVVTGTLVVAFRGPHAHMEPVVARGMHCISPRYMVQTVSANVDLSPVGKVTLVQSLQHCTHLSTKCRGSKWVPTTPGLTPTAALVQALQDQGPRVPPRAPLFLGVKQPKSCTGIAPPADPGDWGRMTMLQMHDPNNLMRTSGFISVQHPVQRGMLCAYLTPLPSLAEEQLTARVEAAVRRVRASARGASGPACGTSGLPGAQTAAAAAAEGARPPQEASELALGVFAFPCVAKGAKFYGQADVETALLSEALPGVPQIGCFCNGEIGPCPPDELPAPGLESVDVLGYSTSIGLLRLEAPPPPPDAELQ